MRVQCLHCPRKFVPFYGRVCGQCKKQRARAMGERRRGELPTVGRFYAVERGTVGLLGKKIRLERFRRAS